MYKNLVLILTLFLGVCCAKPKPEIRIGISHAAIEGGWGTLMYQEIVNEFSLYYEYNVKLIVKDAQRNNQKQFQDIKDLYKSGIDVLIIFPFDSYYTVPIVEDLYDKGVPVVIIDRKLNTSKYNVFLSSDNVKIGFEAGNYALNKLKYKGKILEILGTKGSSTSIDRSDGFRKAIQNFPGVTIGSMIYGEWLEDITMRRTDSVFKSGFIPDLIYVHSDNMALSVHTICDRYHINPVILGVDGLPYKDGGIDMVINKQIDATFYNYPGGDKAAQCAMSLVLKKKVQKDIILKTFPIDSTNAESIKVAYEIQLEQYKKILQQQLQISNMVGVIRSQNMHIYLSLAFIALLVFVVFVISYFLKQKQKFISQIKLQKELIEQQVEEEKTLSDQLTKSNMLLHTQRKEILQKNEYLEKYRCQLEQLVQERTKDLELALEKAKESDKLKTSFLSNLSHEIRTPLNSIVGFSDLLANIKFSHYEKENFRSVIIQSSNQLLNSINQIVTIAKLSTEKVEFKRSVISVTQLFNELNSEIFDRVQLLLKNKNERIDFRIIPPPEVHIETDVFYIKQVLTCLIDNALKFTNSGYIQVGFETVNQHDARFFVKDTGVGVKKESQEIIFEKFRKIEDDTKTLYRGIGLGLAISKQIVELLEGTISVQSEIGKGSEFSFIIPGVVQNGGDHLKLPENHITNFKDKTVLVAEDEDNNFAYIETLLKLKGATVKRARNGLEVYQYCINKLPDIILMDIKMPVMDGIEAFKKIRAAFPGLPVIAITAYSLVNEEKRIINEGFDHYLAKPFTPDALYKMMGELIR